MLFLSSSLVFGACSAPTEVMNATENSSQIELAVEDYWNQTNIVDLDDTLISGINEESNK